MAENDWQHHNSVSTVTCCDILAAFCVWFVMVAVQLVLYDKYMVHLYY